MQEVLGKLGRVLPHSVEVERALLGSILLNSDVLPQVIEVVSPRDFYRKVHRQIYEVILRLFEKQEPIDAITVKDELETLGILEDVGGESYLSEVLESTLTSAHAVHYAHIVKEKALLRGVISAAEEIVTKGYDSVEDAEEFLDWAEGRLLSVAEERQFTSYYHIKDVVKPVLKDIEDLTADKTLDRGVKTGFADLDRVVISFQPTDLIIVAARPSMGKTAFCLNIAEYVARREKKGVGIFSLEMSRDQIIMRMLSSLSRINYTRLRSGYLSPEDFANLARRAAELSECPIFIDDSPDLTVLSIRAKARRMKHELKGNLGLIIIDYLQLMRGRERKDVREQEIAEISRSLKQLAKELNIPVIAISQLNRAVEARSDKRPQLADLRESGALEQDADMVILLYREEFYRKDDTPPDKKGIAEVIVEKNRHGGQGVVQLKWFKEFMRFENLAREN